MVALVSLHLIRLDNSSQKDAWEKTGNTADVFPVPQPSAVLLCTIEPGLLSNAVRYNNSLYDTNHIC